MVECNNKTCEVITEIIFPILGIFTCYFIYLSPFKEIYSLRKSKNSNMINPIPSVMIFCNCLCQIIYSFEIQNYWTFFSNVGGALLGQYYVMMLVVSNIRPKDFKLSVITLITFTGLDIIGGMLAFISFKNDNYEIGRNCLGIICLIVLCAVYISPLTSMFEVIKTRNSSSINLLMTVTFIINGVLWLVYGLFYNDFYIWFPNTIGIVSSIIQFLLYFIFPKKVIHEEHLPTSMPKGQAINNKKDLNEISIDEQKINL